MIWKTRVLDAAPTLYVLVLHDSEGDVIESAFTPQAAIVGPNFSDRGEALKVAEKLNTDRNSGDGWTWHVLEYAPVPF